MSHHARPNTTMLPHVHLGTALHGWWCSRMFSIGSSTPHTPWHLIVPLPEIATYPEVSYNKVTSGTTLRPKQKLLLSYQPSLSHLQVTDKFAKWTSKSAQGRDLSQCHDSMKQIYQAMDQERGDSTGHMSF